MEHLVKSNPPPYAELSNDMDYSVGPSAPRLDHQNKHGFVNPMTQMVHEPQPHQQMHTNTHHQPPPAPVIVQVTNSIGSSRVRGSCAACNTGVLRGHYSCCAICVCLVFFPVGILFCLLMRGRKCSHCGVVY